MSNILGVKLDEYSFSEVMNKITGFMSVNKVHQIVTVNPEFIVAAQNDKEFMNVLNNSDLSIADGFGLKISALITHQKIGERITGVDLTWELAKFAEELGYSIYFLGAKEGVAKKASEKIKILYSNLKIAGTYSGSPEEKGLVERINRSGADILLVAFGAPKQDKFIAKHKYDLKCKIAMGVGGTFDYIAGIIPRAPKWMRSLGLEWLYRLMCEPRRLGRIYTAVIKFPSMVIFK